MSMRKAIVLRWEDFIAWAQREAEIQRMQGMVVHDLLICRDLRIQKDTASTEQLQEKPTLEMPPTYESLVDVTVGPCAALLQLFLVPLSVIVLFVALLLLGAFDIPSEEKTGQTECIEQVQPMQSEWSR